MESRLQPLPPRDVLTPAETPAMPAWVAHAALLEQAARIVADLDDAAFIAESPLAPGGSVGKHLRHCLEFYEALLRGASTGFVDYSDRRRDPRVETSRAACLARLSFVASGLGRLGGVDGRRPLAIRGEDEDARSAWGRSSVLRESQHLLSHTIHHFALVAVLLRIHGVEPPADFGVAPSTLRHWRARGRS